MCNITEAIVCIKKIIFIHAFISSEMTNQQVRLRRIDLKFSNVFMRRTFKLTALPVLIYCSKSTQIHIGPLLPKRYKQSLEVLYFVCTDGCLIYSWFLIN